MTGVGLAGDNHMHAHVPAPPTCTFFCCHCPVAFTIDTEVIQQVKAQFAESRRILKSTGSRAFDLPTDWLPATNDNGPADQHHQDEDADDADEHNSEEGLGEGDDGDGDSSSDDGFFNYFLAGKVIGERQRGGEKEVNLHWYTPSKTLVENAANTDFGDYAKATFNESYVSVEVGKRTQYQPDTSWEPLSAIVATCGALIGNGKKIPAWIKDSLALARGVGIGDGGYQNLPNNKE